MAQDKATWATAHLVRYAQPMATEQLGTVTGPESALTWLYGPEREIDNAGVEPVEQAAVWVGVGYYPGRAAAETVFNSPDLVVPALGDAVEAWHGLLVPFQHRGEFRFCGRGRNDELNTAAGELDPGGLVIVVTSTGYRMNEEVDMSRVEALLQGLLDVRQSMVSTNGLITQHSIDNPDVDLDAITFSIWRDDQAMQAFAYGPGRHREQLALHRDKSMFDRSSFTRLRPVRSAGLWNGVNPAKARP